MVFFHKYFIFTKRFENELGKYYTCTASIFIASKICNQLIPLTELSVFFINQYNRISNGALASDSQAIFEVGEILCNLEFEILAANGFDLNLDLPYKYVYSMRNYYLHYLKEKRYIEITYHYINDSFTLPLCLFYDPILIALASLYLTSQYFKLNLPDTKEGLKWYNLLDKNVELPMVIAVSKEIAKIYKFGREKDSRKGTRTRTEYIGFDSLGILKEKINRSNLDV
jgi:hypothetical protein